MKLPEPNNGANGSVSDWKFAIFSANAIFSDQHSSIEFERGDGSDMNLVTFSCPFVVGALTPKEKILAEFALIEWLAGVADRARFETRMTGALAKKSFTYSTWYKGHSGQSAVDNAVKRFKEELSEASQDDVYTGLVNFLQRINSENPGHPISEWFRNRIAGGGGWASTR